MKTLARARLNSILKRKSSGSFTVRDVLKHCVQFDYVTGGFANKAMEQAALLIDSEIVSFAAMDYARDTVLVSMRYSDVFR
jgi:hypothetical protein